MKPDCKINMKALTGIVDGMLAEKNQMGRKVFEDMTEGDWSGERNSSVDNVGEYMQMYKKFEKRAQEMGNMNVSHMAGAKTFAEWLDSH